MINISDRYTILNKLGQGGSSITYTAVDHKNNQQVAIKALSLTGLDNWKKIELFEREARILQQLDHPAIPKYIDYFQIETEEEIDFYLVQELAPGQSLAHLVSKGWLPEEKTVRDIAEQVLEILVYLQQLTPPVIHRDLKPQNIIYQPDTGKLFLVDFGAVQDAYHHTVMGSTVVGTYGYMAPEQFRGGAVLSTDLYGLGCALLFLLTGESPAELPQKKLKIDWRKVVTVKKSFANWIDKLIEPNINQRFPKADDALLVLLEKKPLADYHHEVIIKPRYSSIKVNHQNHELTIEISSPFKRKRVDGVFYFWLGWSIISILNRLAIFVSIVWLGKLYIILWFYQAIFTQNKVIRFTTQGLFLILFLLMVMFGYSFSIPSFSVGLILIDALFDLILKHNFIQQLLFNTSIAYSNINNNFTIARKIFKSRQKELFTYHPEQLNLPKAFLTYPEKSWLQAEIKQFYR